MSTYVRYWDIQPGRSLLELVAQAEQQLPDMLLVDGAELLGDPHWRVALVMTAPAMPARDRDNPPWESREAYIADLMPEPGWQPSWDEVAA